ncbi:SDR family NAD(P)-dependent oxidoreductase [Streptomyces sp. NPDC058231]|uniref:SDR family NAD(P)-dependent oxidoreductase n=1 Tax=Streptomyces sp. NPDC058231 TaxID=3346392 RepID=UPI0036E0E956
MCTLAQGDPAVSLGVRVNVTVRSCSAPSVTATGGVSGSYRIRTTNSWEEYVSNALEGKVVLVTGASSGIGRATALALSKAGARVAVGARRTDRLKSLIQDASGEMLALEMDVTVRRSVNDAVAATVEHFGAFDILVNNAGVMLSAPILGSDITEWVRMVETNLLGSMYTVHAALPHLLESKGAVVQISSTSGRTASAASGVYAATKFGITAFSEALRQEVTEQGVRVVVIEPGFVSTELAGHITDPTIQAAAKSMAESMRTLQPEDIAAAVVYAVTQPAHVAVNEILIRPTDQTR